MSQMRTFILQKEDGFEKNETLDLHDVFVDHQQVSFKWKNKSFSFKILKEQRNGVIWLQDQHTFKNSLIVVQKEKKFFKLDHSKGLIRIQNEQQYKLEKAGQKNHNHQDTNQEHWEYHSPMPGKIWKILKKVGEPVLVGDVLIQLEAMKVEYTLKATAKGQIQSLLVKEGQVVALGELLLTLTKS